MQYLLILLLIPSTIQAQSPQTEVDSVSFKQFDAQISKFLEKAESLNIESKMHWSVQQLAYNDFLKGERKDLPDIYEAGGEKVLLDSYSQIGQAVALLHTLEHLKVKKEIKNRYRVLLAKYIEVTSNRLFALAEVGEKTNEAKKTARRLLYKKLGLDYSK